MIKLQTHNCEKKVLILKQGFTELFLCEIKLINLWAVSSFPAKNPGFWSVRVKVPVHVPLCDTSNWSPVRNFKLAWRQWMLAGNKIAECKISHTIPMLKILFLKCCLINLISYKPYSNFPRCISAFPFAVSQMTGKAWTEGCVKNGLRDAFYIFHWLNQDF